MRRDKTGSSSESKNTFSTILISILSFFLAIVAGGSTFGEEQGFAEDLLDGYEMIEKLINENDFVLGITAGGHTR